jgi:cell division protein FtsI (penicillin-binding protein 3)
MKSRIAIIFLFLTVCWSVLFIRGMYVQLWPQPRLTELKARLFETTVEIAARRGMILDRNGKELAVAVSGYSLFADPHILSRRKFAVIQLAKLLHMSKSELLPKLNSQRRFVWIKRGLSEELRNTIQSWGLRGLGFVEEPQRVYPQDHLAAQLLGFVGSDGQGLEGVELALNAKLKGQSRRVLLPRDARGRPLIADGRILTEVPDGSDVTLTIDSELQYALESELASAVQIHQAEGAVGVILDAQTSEVLAEAQVPIMSLKRALQTPSEVRRNRAIVDAFEPGSTMKPFVIAAGFAEKKLKPNRRIDCEGGRLKVGGHWITEAEKEHHFGVLTVSEILAYSSNVGMAKIAMELGDQTLRKYLEMFGFGRPTGIDFPGESKGILLALPWRPHLLSNIGFGQGIAVTPMQMAQAYAAIANGGILRRPQILKSVRNSDGGDETFFSPDVGRRIMSASDANVLTFMLTAATTGQATGLNARVPGFPVAGKTGTAQKPDPVHGGYMKNNYISSFAGFVPALDPKFVIYIAVDSPHKGYYGSQVAAPVFSKIAQFAVRKKGLAPILIEDRHLITEESSVVPSPIAPKEMAHGLVPELTGLSLREVFQRLRGLPMTVDVRGSGVVARTVPEAGKSIPATGRVQLILESVTE